MKIKDISSIEDVIYFLNSGHFAKWDYVGSDTFPQIFTWKRETVCATISLAKPLDSDNLWTFEVSAANKTPDTYNWSYGLTKGFDKIDYSRNFSTEISFDDFRPKAFSKWLKTAIKFYNYDKSCWESENKLKEQQERFDELVKTKYPGSEGHYTSEMDDDYGEHYYTHPKVGSFKVDRHLEISSCKIYGEEARKAFRFLAYDETGYFVNDVVDE